MGGVARGACLVLGDSGPDNSADEPCRQGPLGSEPEGPLSGLEGRELVLELLADGRARHEEAAMVPERSEVHEHPVLSERRHPVADHFDGARRRRSDRPS